MNIIFFSFEANVSWHTDRCKRTFKTSWREYVSWWLVSTITLSPWFIKHFLFLRQSSTKGISCTSVFIMVSRLSMRSDDQDHVTSVTALCTTALKFLSYCVKCYFTPQILYQQAFLDKTINAFITPLKICFSQRANRETYKNTAWATWLK